MHSFTTTRFIRVIRAAIAVAAVAWIGAAGTFPAAAHAQQGISPEKERVLRAAIQTRTGDVAIDSISATPIPGIYAVASDGELFYTDESGRYGFVNASLVDMQTRQDLSAQMLDKINKIDFRKLPLASAIKEVHGKGSRTIAVFEDPNCPVCRVFTKFLDQIPDVTIYRFMYPVISPESEELARAAWCSSNRAGAWKSIMGGARPQEVRGTNCDISGLTAIVRFGEKHRIQDTPTVVLANGKRLVGATPPEQLMQELDAGGR